MIYLLTMTNYTNMTVMMQFPEKHEVGLILQFLQRSQSTDVWDRPCQCIVIECPVHMQLKTIVSIISLPSKVDVRNLITHLNRTPIFQWHVVRCGSNYGYKKRHVCKQDWTTCS